MNSKYAHHWILNVIFLHLRTRVELSKHHSYLIIFDDTLLDEKETILEPIENIGIDWQG